MKKIPLQCTQEKESNNVSVIRTESETTTSGVLSLHTLLFQTKGGGWKPAVSVKPTVRKIKNTWTFLRMWTVPVPVVPLILVSFVEKVVNVKQNCQHT